jgi:hypothetical protein
MAALLPEFTATLTTLADISSPTTCASPLYAHRDPLHNMHIDLAQFVAAIGERMAQL